MTQQVIQAGGPSGTPSGAMRRIAIIAQSGGSIRQLRRGLISAIVHQGHHIMCMAPSFDKDHAATLSALGATMRNLPERPKGFQLFPERATIASLATSLAEWTPHAVLASGQDLLPIALRAAWRAKVPRKIALINGLEGTDHRALKRALELADAAVFHNTDDLKALQAAGALPADLAYTVVAGAGVDLDHYAAKPLPPFGAGLVFLMIARLDRKRGVLDYCEAARLLKARAPSASFKLAGPPGNGASGLTAADVERYGDAVEYLGSLDDVRPALDACHVFVYPSHREGMPPAVLEALARGRPVITTNVPGCKETVDERVNGCLVPPSDPVALAAAMETFLKRPDLIPHLARASRAKAERRFDARAVNAALMSVLGVA